MSFLIAVVIGFLAVLVGALVSAYAREAFSRSGSIVGLVVGLSMAGMIVTWRAAINVIVVGAAAYIQLSVAGSLSHALLITGLAGFVSGFVLSFTLK